MAGENPLKVFVLAFEYYTKLAKTPIYFLMFFKGIENEKNNYTR